jgi:ATP-binding cassette, subfamily B, bacterial MsbA
MPNKKIWWPFLQQNKWKVIALALPGLCSSYCSLLIPLSIGKYLEIIFTSANGKTRALQLLGIHLPDVPAMFFLFFVGLLLLKFLTAWLYQYHTALLGESFVHQLRLQLFSTQLQHKQHNQPINEGALLTYSNDARAMQQLLVKGVIGFVKDLLLLGMTLYLLFALSVQLTAIVAALTPLFFFVYRWYNRKQKSVFTNKRNRQASLLKHVSKMLLTAAPDTGDTATRQYNKKSEHLGEALKAYHSTKALQRALAPFLLYGMLAIIMATIIWIPGKEKMEAGEITAYLLLLMNSFPTIRNIIKIQAIWMQGALSAKKFSPAHTPTGTAEAQQNSGTVISAPLPLNGQKRS